MSKTYVVATSHGIALKAILERNEIITLASDLLGLPQGSKLMIVPGGLAPDMAEQLRLISRTRPDIAFEFYGPK